MEIAILSFTAAGEKTACRLQQGLEAAGHILTAQRCAPGMLDSWTREQFGQADALIYVGACGIAVRAIAPYVQKKTADPAVLAADEQGDFVIALLSGHIGGANRLTEEAAAILGAVPVITTATDRRGLPAIDTWASEQGLHIADAAAIRMVSGRLLAGETVLLQSDVPLTGSSPTPLLQTTDGPAHVRITCRSLSPTETTPEGEPPLHLIPAVLTLGIGCKKGTEEAALTEAYQQFLAAYAVHPAAIRAAASIDLKADEAGLLAFCRRHHLPFYTYSAAALMEAPGTFSASAFVAEVTGADNVCERSAILAAGAGSRILAAKTCFSGITMALAYAPLTLQFPQKT